MPTSLVPGTFRLAYTPSIPDGTDLSAASEFSLIFETPQLAPSGRGVTISGPDRASFKITSVSYGPTDILLQLEFIGGVNGGVDIVHPGDANGDNKYIFTITVDDGTHNPPSVQTFVLPIAL